MGAILLGQNKSPSKPRRGDIFGYDDALIFSIVTDHICHPLFSRYYIQQGNFPPI